MKSFLLAMLLCWLFLPVVFSQQTIVLQPGPAEGKDACVNSAYPDDPFGDTFGFEAVAWTYGGVPGIVRSFIRFDLSGISPNAHILDARLTLSFDPEAACGVQSGENASVLEKVTGNWNEMTVTWATQPMFSTNGAVFIAKTQTPAQDLENIDVTGFVSDWVANPNNNFGMVFHLVTEVEYTSLVFASSDKSVASMRPKLVVTYRDCDVPVAGFSFSTQIPSVSFSDTSTSATSWFWDFGDGYFSNLQNPGHMYAAQGVYQVCLAVIDSCGSDTICHDVQVCDMPEPRFYYTTQAQMVSFRDSSTLPQTWFWDFGDGFYSDLRNPEHFFNEPKTYYVCEKVTNACGMQTFCDSVTIIASGMDDHSARYDVNLFPNPGHDLVFLNLDVHAASIVYIELLTLQNSSLRKWVSPIGPGDAPISLDIAGLSKGIYLLQTKIDGIIRLNKLIIL